MIYHSQMAAVLNSYTRFRLLNDPGPGVGAKDFSIAGPGRDIDSEIRNAHLVLASDSIMYRQRKLQIFYNQLDGMLELSLEVIDNNKTIQVVIKRSQQPQHLKKMRVPEYGWVKVVPISFYSPWQQFRSTRGLVHQATELVVAIRRY